MPNPALLKTASFDGIPSDRGQCDWVDRPLAGNLVGDRLQIMDRGLLTATWTGLGWVMSQGAMVDLTGSRSATLDDCGVPLKSTSGSATALTIQNDATSGWSMNEVLTIYWSGAGAISFVAGASVTFRGSAPTVAQFGSMSMWRVGPNEWAYL